MKTNIKIAIATVIVAALAGIVVPVILEIIRHSSDSVNKDMHEHEKKIPIKELDNTVNAKYWPSGIMGDTGDVRIVRDKEIDRFVYEVKGRGPHEWNWKYVNGEINTRSAQFAGVMYLEPPDNCGQSPNGGFNVAKTRNVIKWETRSLGDDAMVEFVIGGVEWFWNEKGQKVNAPYPDSMPRLSLGIFKLTKDWENFEYHLSDQPKEYFTRVVGGFGWVINWGSNNISPNDEGTAPLQTKTFTIELRNIRYER